MRIKRPETIELKEGDERTVRKYLILPLTINGETRWLEKSNIKQVVKRLHGLSPASPPEGTFLHWVSVEWLNEV